MNELVKPISAIDLAKNLDSVLTLGGALIKSGLLPNSINTPEAAMAIIIKGNELGLQAMQSFDFIDNIKGKPTLKPQGMLALILSSPLCAGVSINESTDDGCTVTMARKGQKPHTEIFTMEDAKKLGLASKDNWKKQPKTMLKWRAISACARIVFPDVTQGLYTPEEIGDENIIDVEVAEIEAKEIIEAESPKSGPTNPHKITPEDAERLLDSLQKYLPSPNTNEAELLAKWEADAKALGVPEKFKDLTKRQAAQLFNFYKDLSPL